MKFNTLKKSFILAALAATVGAQAQNRLYNASFEISQVTSPAVATNNPTTGGLLDVDGWRLYSGARLNCYRKTFNGNASVDLADIDAGIEQDFNILPNATSGLNLLYYDYTVDRNNTVMNEITNWSVYPTSGGAGAAGSWTESVPLGSSGSYMWYSNAATFNYTDSGNGMATISMWGWNPNGKRASFDNLYLFNCTSFSNTPTFAPCGFSAFNNTHNQGNLYSLENQDGLRAMVGCDQNASAGWLVAGYWNATTIKPNPTTLRLNCNAIKSDWDKMCGDAYMYVSIWDWTTHRWVSMDGFLGSGLKVPYLNGNLARQITTTSATLFSKYYDPATKMVLFRVAFGQDNPVLSGSPSPRFQISVDQIQVISL